MLDATVLGKLITKYTLDGKDGVDTPIRQADGSTKTSRQMSEESMIQLARAIIEHFTQAGEFTSYIPGGQPIVMFNTPDDKTPPGTRGLIKAVADTGTGAVTFDPLIISTPAAGDTSTGKDPAALKGVVTLK